MQINVLAFGQVAGVTGNQFVIDEPVNDTDGLQTLLAKKYPEIIQMKFAMAVNKTMVHENVKLHDMDSVALLPPFSGG